MSKPEPDEDGWFPCHYQGCLYKSRNLPWLMHHESKHDEHLKVLNDVSFDHDGKFFKMRHYNDGVWELLDENDLPIIQGFCSDTGEVA